MERFAGFPHIYFRAESVEQIVGENMAQTSAPAARPGYLRRIWPVVATLLLLAGLSGCGEESPEVLPPTAQAPAQETPLTPVLPTPTTAQAPAQETPQTTVLPTPTTTEELRSDRDRSTSPRATRADLRELVQGNNDFAFDLYRALNDEEGNLFYSPFSISQALAMTFAGARGETERQMADTLQYRLSQGSLHPAFNALGSVVIFTVIPAKAGIQRPLAANAYLPATGFWVPAFAGMTETDARRPIFLN